MTDSGLPAPGWYQDPDHRTRIRYWDGRSFLRVSQQTAIGTRKEKLPESLLKQLADDRPPNLYEVPDSDQERRWWNGTKWSATLLDVLEGFVGQLIVCLESMPTAYRLDAVEKDFIAVSRPWDSKGGSLALFPIHQIIAIYPGLITVAEGGVMNSTDSTGSCAVVIGGNQTTSDGPRAFVGYSVTM